MFLMLVIMHLLLLCSSVASAQSKDVGHEELQLNQQASISFAINIPPNDIHSVHWRWSLPDAKTAPHDNLIIQKIGSDVNVGPGYDRRVDITSMRRENSLVIYTVTDADLSLRYWFQANVRGKVIQDSVLPTLLDDPSSSDEFTATMATGITMITVTNVVTNSTSKAKTSRRTPPDVTTIMPTTPEIPSPPGPISNLQVFDTGKRQVTVTWNPGYSGGIGFKQWFVVTYFEISKENKAEIPKVTVKVHNSWCFLDGLKPGTVYKINVESENRAGRSGKSHTTSHKTDKNEALIYIIRIDYAYMILTFLGVIIAVLVIVVIVVHNLRRVLHGDLPGKTKEDKIYLLESGNGNKYNFGFSSDK